MLPHVLRPVYLHHKQYVDQVGLVLRFLLQRNAMSEEHIDLLWDITQKPDTFEEVKINVLDLLAALAWHFRSDQLDSLFGRFESASMSLARGSFRTSTRPTLNLLLLLLLLLRRLYEHSPSGYQVRHALTSIRELVLHDPAAWRTPGRSWRWCRSWRGRTDRGSWRSACSSCCGRWCTPVGLRGLTSLLTPPATSFTAF